MLNQPSLAILIDFWHPVRFPENRIDNTLAFLNSTSYAIKTVVLATYNSRSELFFQNNSLWYRNRKDWYEKSCVWARDKSISDDTKSIKNKTFNNARTDSRILQYCNPNQYQIAMFQYWEMEYYLSVHPEIKNIYVVGAAWEECIRHRPLGYLELSQLKTVNILTHTDLVRSNKSEQLDLSSYRHWIKIEGNIYQYLGNKKVDP